MLKFGGNCQILPWPGCMDLKLLQYCIKVPLLCYIPIFYNFDNLMLKMIFYGDFRCFLISLLIFLL